MAKIRMMVELTYDAKTWHGKDAEAKEWFFNGILKSRRKNDLLLHSNEVGDQIGPIKVLETITK